LDKPRETTLADIRPAREMSGHTASLIAEAIEPNHRYSQAPLSGYAAGRLILAGDTSVRLAVILDALAWLEAQQQQYWSGGWKNSTNEVWMVQNALRSAVVGLARGKLELHPTDIRELLGHVGAGQSQWLIPVDSILTMIEGWCRQSGRTLIEATIVNPQARRLLLTFAEERLQAGRAEHRRTGERLKRLLFGQPAEPPIIREPLFVWAKPLEALTSTASVQQAHWIDLLRHARLSENKSAPSKSWLTTARAIRAKIGQDPVSQLTLLCLENSIPDPTTPDPNDNILKGLIWMLSDAEPGTTAGVVGNFAALCFQKVPGVGARSYKLGNACLHVLAELQGLEPLSQLVRIRNRTRYPTVRSLVDKKLRRVAERLELSQPDLEELSVPAYGLSPSGEVEQTIGESKAVISLNEDGDVTLQWIGPDLKPRAAPPKAMREAYPDDVKKAKRLVRTLEDEIAAQTRRIERLLATERELGIEAWRQRYGDHPLVSILAKRLIWHVIDANGAVPALWRGKQFERSDGTVLSVTNAKISLWHPIQSSAGEVLAWRQRLRALDVKQPIKQAFREIYRLTDAERHTEVYSNRFAAHIMRQHQFGQLCQQRNWRYSLQGMFDGANTPCLELPGNLEASFFVEPIESEASPSSIYLYVATDQVRFRRRDTEEPLMLDKIPERVFSEVMRDVDLFVSVCTIGNNPEWTDGGAVGPFNYWREYSFGNLTGLGESRRELLQEVLPSLAIADQCEIDSKYVKVRGNLRSYKIHIGSGNILMEPNDQYLCIVPAPAKPGKGPGSVINFDGDRTFSIIISKALMLARDDEIGDSSIVRQIRTGLN
jgi:hypothetical protein